MPCEPPPAADPYQCVRQRSSWTNAASRRADVAEGSRLADSWSL